MIKDQKKRIENCVHLPIEFTQKFLKRNAETMGTRSILRMLILR
jgi:hypothetical protein